MTYEDIKVQLKMVGSNVKDFCDRAGYNYNSIRAQASRGELPLHFKNFVKLFCAYRKLKGEK